MGVITHRPWQDEILQVRGECLIKVSLDALGLPAPTDACGPHICPSTTGARACGHTGVGLAEHAWAGVEMRGHAWAHARTTEDVRCGVPAQQRRTRLRQAWAAEPACRRPVCTHNRCVVQLWRTQVEHAHGYEAQAHLDLCADQLEYRVSSEPSSGRATRLTPPSSAPAARPSRTSARDVVA